MLTNLLLPSGYVGPGSYVYPVSPYAGGAVLYVNSATGLDNRGRLTIQGAAATTTQSASAQGPYTDPSKPLATVFGANGALKYCQASRGDLIIVAPGHTETIPAGAVTIPASVSILGCGYGGNRPTFSYGATTTEIDTAGAGIQIQNCVFDMATVITGVVLGFKIAHAGFQMVNSRLIMATSANAAVAGILLNTGADDFQFVSSEIDATAGAGAAFGIKNVVLNTINRPFIVNSWIHGDFSTAPLSILTVLAKEILVENNTFKQLNAAKTVWNLATGNTITGYFTNNDMFAPSAGAHGDFIAGGTGTGFSWFQNFGAAVNASPRSAILIPDVGTIP